MEKYCRDRQATDDNMAPAHWVPANQGYKHKHLCCAILIAVPLQQWLYDSTSMLRYTYSACLFRLIRTACHVSRGKDGIEGAAEEKSRCYRAAN